MSSAWSRAELACVFRRHVRGGGLTPDQARQLQDLFRSDVVAGVWTLVPVSAGLLDSLDARLRALPADLFLRAGDAVHLHTAATAGLAEIWSNDRHLLHAASSFGLVGRSVESSRGRE
jgi:predicted nucleic acid-binding protein